MSHAPEVDLAELLTEVRRIQMHSSRLVTNVMAGAYDSVFRGAGLEFDEVREYVEGEDPVHLERAWEEKKGQVPCTSVVSVELG